MKLFSTVIHRKRGIILFTGAFVLPLLFVIGISLDTFSRRQRTNRNLLESNLWYSGRSALMQFESRFEETEDSLLDAGYIQRVTSGSIRPGEPMETGLFLLDHRFNLIYPETGDDQGFLYRMDQPDWGPEFKRFMDRAEMEGMINRNQAQAIRKYRNAYVAAGTVQQKAMAIEGLARTWLAAKDFRQAAGQYRILASQYPAVVNRSGHPYGLSAPLQLHAIGVQTREEVIAKDSLMEIYRRMKEGHWPMSESSWRFFLAEYESILGNEARSVPARYGQTLELAALLKELVIPRLLENRRIPGYPEGSEPRRYLIYRGEVPYLVSCREYMPPGSENQFLAGICMNLDSLLTSAVPLWINRMAEETRLDITLLDGKQYDLFKGAPAAIPEGALLLPFNTIPLPWTLMAVQPGFEKLDTEGKIQVAVFGILLLFIIILMFFGVLLLLRDINRETESMLQRTEFVHNVSHELKTPLSLIRLYGETLMIVKDLAEADRNEALLIITKETERLSHMINNILDFSKIEMGRKEFDIREDALADVVRDTLESYRYHIEKNGFTIDIQIMGDLPSIPFDRNAIEAMLINLLSNAIKYSPEEKWIGIQAWKSADTVFLTVSDHGSGIPETDLPHVFDRFYRSASSRGSQAKGSGLGLTLVKHTVEEHGWTIDVISNPGEGTTFTIRIPLNAGRGL
jgi:signal transduction histidine kinase